MIIRLVVAGLLVAELNGFNKYKLCKYVSPICSKKFTCQMQILYVNRQKSAIVNFIVGGVDTSLNHSQNLFDSSKPSP